MASRLEWMHKYQHFTSRNPGRNITKFLTPSARKQCCNLKQAHNFFVLRFYLTQNVFKWILYATLAKKKGTPQYTEIHIEKKPCLLFPLFFSEAGLPSRFFRQLLSQFQTPQSPCWHAFYLAMLKKWEIKSVSRTLLRSPGLWHWLANLICFASDKWPLS